MNGPRPVRMSDPRHTVEVMGETLSNGNGSSGLGSRSRPAQMELSHRERAMLAIEAAEPRPSARKDARIARELGISTVRYHQLLSRLVASEAAIAADPLLIGRLRRRSGAGA